MAHFIVYSLATGAILRAGGPVPVDEVHLQASAERGEGVVEAGDDALTVIEVAPGMFQSTISLAAVRRSVCAGIDKAAGDARLTRITDIPGQDEVYRAKAAEAFGWTPGAPAASAPYLAREAELCGVPLAERVAQVRALATDWLSLSHEIEGVRTSAKRAVACAETIPAMLAAAAIDWNGITGTGV